MKKNILSLILVVVIIVSLVLVILQAESPSKDIDVKVLDIYNQNNQDSANWISDMFLLTFQVSTIDLIGVGAGYKIKSGKTISLNLMSAELNESIPAASFSFKYTAFSSGNNYTVEI